MKLGLVLLIVLILVIAGIYIIYTKTDGCNPITGEGCNTQPCDDGFVFSQKDCRCVPDSSGCEGLDKEACELNSNCFSYNRAGTCDCPACKIYLEHQCLPREHVSGVCGDGYCNQIENHENCPGDCPMSPPPVPQ